MIVTRVNDDVTIIKLTDQMEASVKTKQIDAKVTIGKMSFDCPTQTVELPSTVDELIGLDVKAKYGVDSSVVDLFNGALAIRIQAKMRADYEKQLLAEFVASRKERSE